MKKSAGLSAAICAAALSAFAAVPNPAPAAPGVCIPLEWNVRRPLDAPYEIEIDTCRLIELGVTAKPSAGCDTSPATAFAIEATVGGQAVRVPVAGLKGHSARHVRLRFLPPAGTTALALLADGAEKFELADSVGCDNLLAGMLDAANVGRWKVDDKVVATVSRVRDGILLDGGKRNDNVFQPGGVECVMPLPEGVAGLPVAFEMDVRSLAKETWANDIRIRQLDAHGNELPESVVDPRWISHMRPPEKTCRFRERGRLHPAARALKFRFGLRWNNPGVGADGLPADVARFRPKLLISHVAMRVARELPFPALDDRNFSAGVSGEPGDAALNIGTNGVFFHQTRSQASWAEAVELRRESDCFFPFRAGTIEAWFKPRFEELRHPYTLFCAAHANGRTETGPRWPVSRGELIQLTYHPGTRALAVRLKDRADRDFAAEGLADIADGEWTHVALTFAPGGEARVFLNGRQALTCSLAGFVPYDPEHAKFPNTDGPVELYVGSSYRTIPDARGPRANQPTPALAGVLDVLRVSTGVRYTADFAPARAFACDADTRALFNFDRSFDGVSGGGIGVVPGSFWCSRPRAVRTIVANGKTCPYFPEEVVAANDPRKVFRNLNYPIVPAAADFARAYAKRSFSAEVRPGDALQIEAPKGVVTDAIEIRNTGAAPLAYPVLLNAGDIDARSFADIAATLARPGLDDRARANRIFDFMLKSSDYFMHHVPTYSPGSDMPRSVEYEALMMLNGYCGFECGPLNNLTANVFANAGHIPAVRTGGYGHEFEEVFFDAQNHIYDLSARKFFPAYDNVTAAGLREVDDEPGIISRYGGRPAAFARRSNRFHIVQAPGFQAKVGPTLNPGERFIASFANDGHVNDLQFNPMFTGCRRTIDRKLKPYKWDCTAETHSTPRKGDELCRVERYFPDYGNAFVVFDGRPAKDNPAFVQVADDSFAYSVKSAYPIVWCDYRATRADGTSAAIELSTDFGKTWRPLAAPADRPVMGRVAYLVRIKAPIADIANFRAVTETQFNPRVFPGRLREGANALAFKAVAGETARVTVRYRTPAKDISVAGAAMSGAIVGFEKRLLAFDPAAPATFAVKGLGAAATVRTHGPVAARLAHGRLELSAVADASYPAFAAVTLVEGEAEQEFKVLAAPSVRFALAERPFFLKKAEDQARFAFAALPAGKYVILQLERYAAVKPNTWSHNLLVTVPGHKAPQPAGSIWNPGIDFYACIMGTPGPGARGNWKWDFPNEPESQYPYTLLREWELPQGTDALTYSIWGKNVPEGGVEVAACLVLPAPDAAFRAELVKQLTGFRTAVALPRP